MIMELPMVKEVEVAGKATIPDQKVVSGTPHWIDNEK